MDPSSEGMPDQGPVAPPGTAEELFRQAEDFRHRQVWEEAIRFYRFSLQKDPSNPAAHKGLAASYEAKSREPGYESYLQSAMGEYRKIIAQNPTSNEAHDSLLAAAVRAGELDALMEEYKARIAKGGDVEAFRKAFGKMRSLFLVQTEQTKSKIEPPPAIVSFLFGSVAPGISLIAGGAAMFVRLKGGANHNAALISLILLKISLGAFFSFLAYKVFLFWRESR
jgi:tetratricopeptide (TPR) repeat protein